jgi:glycosyltransferase involved in cell wall biosynthesis
MLASSDDEWIAKLSKLIDDSGLRRRCAENGRTTVEEKFSVDAIKGDYLKYFNQLTSKNK